MPRFVTLAILLMLAALTAARPTDAPAATTSPTATPAAQQLQLPPHPRLLFNHDGIEQFKQKITQEPWRTQWADLLSSLNKDLRSKIELPPRGGNWSHNYVCPTHGARLSQGRKIGPWQWEHKCPVGPHILHGNPAKASLDFDGNGIAGVHGHYAGMLRDLGLAWQVTGDRRYADHARAILLAYAERYLTYPRHGNDGRPVRKQGTGGRVASQNLTEASWLTSMAQGADLIWDVLSPAEQETAARRLFRPALEETILNRATKPTIHNIQCHRDSAVGLVGFLLGDQALITHAIDGIHGYRANMAKGVQPDGVWFEGSWGYHFFTLGGVWPLTEAARNCGIDLYGPELKRMFDAPLTLTMPNDRLPAFNDSSEIALSGRGDTYELAYARYHDPAYGALLARDDRSSRLALWFGVSQLSEAAQRKAGSHSAEASGYTILQRGDGPQATWLCLKYGPHGGGHGHFDKNNFVLYAAGEVVMPDTGSHAYGSPLHAHWDKTSFAHNTLVVDQASQDQATGRQLCFGSASGVDYAMTDAGAIYPGVRFVRTAALIDQNTILFIDHIQAEKACTLDLAAHFGAKWAEAPAGQSFTAPEAPGYDNLRDATTRPCGAAGLTLAARTGKDRPIAITLAGGSQPTEVITATGVGASTEQRVPLAVFRRNARETDFIWAVSLEGKPVKLETSTPRPGATTVVLTAQGQRCRVESDPTQATVRITKE